MTGIAYLILAHKEPERIARLVNRLQTSDDFFYVHLGADLGKQKVDDWTRIIKNECPNVNLMVASEIPCTWGSFGSVDSTLRAMKYIQNLSYDYFVNLSGECYPIKPVDTIKKTLGGQASAFIEVFDLPYDFWENGGMNRIRNRFYFFSKGRYYPKIFHIPRLNKKLPYNLKPYGGSQWFCLPKEIVSFILEFVNRNPKVLIFFKKALIPDEMFFQTILANSPLKSRIQNDNKRYIDWAEGKNGHPKYLTRHDFNQFLSSEKLFARKFSLLEDNQILDMIDQKLDTGFSQEN